jgi:hypothetical protein
MGTRLSSKSSPPFVTANSCLMHVFALWPLPKCGRSSRPRIPIFSSPFSHWYGWLVDSPTRVLLMVCVKTLCASSRNMALSFPTWPSSSVPSYTLDGMHGRKISIAGFLRGDLGICSLSFCCNGGWLKVPMVSICSFVTHSDQAEIYSLVSPAGCSEMVV